MPTGNSLPRLIRRKSNRQREATWTIDAIAASAAVETIFKGKGPIMMKTIFDAKYDEGVADGKSELGRNMVLTVLRAKFKRVPREVEKTIRAISDPIALESWAAQAATCQSMEEFAEALR